MDKQKPTPAGETRVPIPSNPREALIYPSIERWVSEKGWTLAGGTGQGIKVQICQQFNCFPDIVGTRKTLHNSLETLAVEVKNDLRIWSRGIGQAALYQEFANYSYLALPKGIHFARGGLRKLPPNEILVPLLKRLGIGLLFFEYGNPAVVDEVVAPLKQAPTLTQWLQQLKNRPSEAHSNKEFMRSPVRNQPSRHPEYLDLNVAIAKLVGLLVQNGPHINALARQLGVFKETARYWYKHLLLGRGLTVTAVPNYSKLGLERLILIAEIPPTRRAEVETIISTMGQLCYVVGCEETAVEGWFIIHVSVPKELVESCLEVYEQIKHLGIFSHLQIYRFQFVRIPRMKSEYFDFMRGVWNYDWSFQEGDQPIHFDAQQRAPYDLEDLVILKELQENAGGTVSRMAKLFDAPYREWSWHYSRHIAKKGLIESYALNWTGTEYGQAEPQSDTPRELLPICVLLPKAEGDHQSSLIAFVHRLPFLWFEAAGEDYYFGSVFVPVEMVGEFLSRLGGADIGAQKLRYFILKQSKAKNFTIPYHLFDGASMRWQLDQRLIMEKFHNVLQQRE